MVSIHPAASGGKLLINSKALIRRITVMLAAAGLSPALFPVSAQPPQSAPARRLLKVDDMHAFHDVSDPQISPGGNWVASTVSPVDTAADKGDTDVWMASWDGTRQIRMTSQSGE